jgi:4-alpha-glucanotransferase
MKRHGVKRMFVVQFEAGSDDPPLGTPPEEAVASLNTHDMPPFAAYWNALDAELRQEMGLISAAEVGAQRAQRNELARTLSAHLRRQGFLDNGVVDRLRSRKADTRDALRALLEFLAHSPAHVALVNLEDLWLEEQPQNVPGTSQEKPNWRRRMRFTFDELRNQTDLDQTLERIHAARRSGKDNHE